MGNGPEPRRQKEEEDGEQRTEVHARTIREDQAPILPGQGAGSEVGRERHPDQEQEDDQSESDDRSQNREGEHVEGEVPPEDGIGHSPGRSVEEEERPHAGPRWNGRPEPETDDHRGERASASQIARGNPFQDLHVANPAPDLNDAHGGTDDAEVGEDEQRRHDRDDGPQPPLPEGPLPENGAVARRLEPERFDVEMGEALEEEEDPHQQEDREEAAAASS